MSGSGSNPLWPIATAVVLCVVAWLVLGQTPMMTPPAGRAYVAAATSLAEGHGLQSAEGVPLARFAPLYALLLAPFSTPNQNALPTAYLLNCAALALTLLAFYWLARVLSTRAAPLASALFAVWAGHYYLLRSVRPDGLAIALTLLTLVALLRYGRRQQLSDLLSVAGLAALAALSRYMTAITLLPVMAYGIFRLTRGATRLRWSRTAIASLCAGLPTVVWLLRNRQLTGHLFGVSRTESRIMAQGSDLPTNLARLGKTLSSDLFAPDAMGTLPASLGELSSAYPRWIVFASIVTLIVFVLALVRCSAEDRRALFGAPSGMVLVLYPVFYVVMLIVLWTVGNNDPIHTRFVAPLYPFLALLILALAGRMRSRRLVLGGLLLVAAMMLLPSAIKSVGLLADPPSKQLLEIEGRKKRGSRWRSELLWPAVSSHPPRNSVTR